VTLQVGLTVIHAIYLTDNQTANRLAYQWTSQRMRHTG